MLAFECDIIQLAGLAGGFLRYNVKDIVWGTNGVRKTRKSHHINALDSKQNAHGYANPSSDSWG